MRVRGCNPIYVYPSTGGVTYTGGEIWDITGAAGTLIPAILK
ncbi:MAG TPA: hypothetical protein VMP68_11615 [Candidatus Eisenbacteria bacterium]|nr:hypothetical protein [Candidatus Eisenbacteria bacterium]